MSAVAYDPLTAAERLRSGGVALLPTDTNYALGCVPTNEAACARLYSIKNRPPEKPLTLFVRNAAEASLYADLAPAEKRLFDELTKRFWPGPINLVVPASARVPRHRFFDPHSVSLVCNRNRRLAQLLDALDGPLAMTSANVSGVNVDGLVTSESATAQFGGDVDVRVPADTAEMNTTCSSTIVRITDGRLEVVRQGDVIVAT